MIFYYDPLFGLRYWFDNTVTDFLMIDIASIPKNFDMKEFVKEWENHIKNIGTIIIDSKEVEFETIDVYPKIISNTEFYNYD